MIMKFANNDVIGLKMPQTRTYLKKNRAQMHHHIHMYVCICLVEVGEGNLAALLAESARHFGTATTMYIPKN